MKRKKCCPIRLSSPTTLPLLYAVTQTFAVLSKLAFKFLRYQIPSHRIPRRLSLWKGPLTLKRRQMGPSRP